MLYPPSAWHRLTGRYDPALPGTTVTLGQSGSTGSAYQTASHLWTCTLRSDQLPLTVLGRHSRRRNQVPKVVRREQRQTHPGVGHEPMARQPSPVQGVLPLFDPLLGCPSTIVESHHSFGASRHVVTMKPTRGNSSPLRHSRYMVPTLSTIPKVVVCTGLLRRNRSYPVERSQGIAVRQPYGVEDFLQA